MAWMRRWMEERNYDIEGSDLRCSLENLQERKSWKKWTLTDGESSWVGLHILCDVVWGEILNGKWLPRVNHFRSSWSRGVMMNHCHWNVCELRDNNVIVLQHSMNHRHPEIIDYINIIHIIISIFFEVIKSCQVFETVKLPSLILQFIIKGKSCEEASRDPAIGSALQCEDLISTTTFCHGFTGTETCTCNKLVSKEVFDKHEMGIHCRVMHWCLVLKNR